jgi:hypothetical protein
LVTCGLDKKLVCVDVGSGEVRYSVALDSPPLCLDVDPQVRGVVEGEVGRGEGGLYIHRHPSSLIN